MKNNSIFSTLVILAIIALVVIAGFIFDIAVINSDMPILLKLWLLK